VLIAGSEIGPQKQSFIVGFVDDLEEQGSKINNKYENMNKALFGLADCNHRIIIISDNPMVRDKAEGEEKSEMSFRCGSNIKDTIEKLAGVEKLDKKLPEWQPFVNSFHKTQDC
jgi:hypothetical protein